MRGMRVMIMAEPNCEAGFNKVARIFGGDVIEEKKIFLIIIVTVV